MSQTTPTTEAPPPADGTPLIVADPVLMETLAALDRDISGETKFCHQAAEALRAFQVRWSNDIAVEDAYGQAIKALDTMRSVLAGADVRWSDALTRTVLTRQEAERAQAAAKVEREHALTWAEQPPPTPPETPPLATEPPPEAGVQA